MVKGPRSRLVVTGVAVIVALGAFAAPAAPAAGAKAKAKAKKCKAYVPGDLGAEAETTIVTDAATEAAPIEVTLPTTPGAGFTSTEPGGDTGATSHSYHNVQIDSKAKTAALFVRAEFVPLWDMDLFLRDNFGVALAYEADFNQAPEAGLGSTSGGHAERGVSQIDGWIGADCSGYTVDVASSVGGGPSVTLKLWLGES